MSERTHDIVERLKIAQTNTASIYPVRPKLLQDAIDEIVALRRTIRLGPDLPALAREQALDEAVQACTDQTSDDPPPGTYNDACEDCAAAIRLLKEKGDG